MKIAPQDFELQAAVSLGISHIGYHRMKKSCFQADERVTSKREREREVLVVQVFSGIGALSFIISYMIMIFFFYFFFFPGVQLLFFGW